MNKNNTEWKLEEMEITFEENGDTNDNEMDSKDEQDNA
jgi:hypothetical protein